MIAVLMRAKVETLQEALSRLPQYEPPTKHYFHGGMYCREVFREAGVLVVGKVHRKEHFYVIASGSVLITNGSDEPTEVVGPCVIKSMPGTKRAVYSLSPTTCMTFHRTDSTDVEAAEAELVEEDDRTMYLPGNRVKQEVAVMTFWVAGAVVVGSVINSNASGNAVDAQTNAENQANATRLQMYNQTREDQTPYRESGYNALKGLNSLMNDPSSLSSQPGYQFGMNEGVKGIDRSASAHGNLYSGATLKALDRYGQDYAGAKLNESYNRLANVAGLGQVAVNGTNNQNYGNQVSASQIDLGNAQGANALNQGNVWGNAINQLGAYGNRNGWFSGGGATQGVGPYSGADYQNGSDIGWNPSDVRLKTNITRIGTTKRGHALYVWDWIDGSGSSSGVLAQEVMRSDPSAVKTGPDGFLMVDYRKV